MDFEPFNKVTEEKDIIWSVKICCLNVWWLFFVLQRNSLEKKPSFSNDSVKTDNNSVRGRQMNEIMLWRTAFNRHVQTPQQLGWLYWSAAVEFSVKFKLKLFVCFFPEGWIMSKHFIPGMIWFISFGAGKYRWSIDYYFDNLCRLANFQVYSFI